MIILAGTPIGNLGDASARLREALEATSVIAAEDTRVAMQLLLGLGIANRPRLISMFEHNEGARVDEMLEIASQTDVVVLTDAGMPTISDPGYQLVAAARAADVPVTIIPGPSAVVTALAVSGLPTDRFSFEGFVPRKSGDRRRLWHELVTARRTLIFFESPHRLADTLAGMVDVFGGERPATVCRELTKKFEEVRHGTLDELAAWAQEGVRGEITLVIGGATEVIAVTPEDVVEEVLALVANGERMKTACATIALAHGVSRNRLYELALAARPSE